MKIEAKVARILSEQQVVLNKGRRDSVEVGMVFTIGDETLDHILDPDTGEDLGSVGAPRPAFEVVQVGERVALAVRYQSAGDLSVALSAWSVRSRGRLGLSEWEQLEIGTPAIYSGQRASRLY